MLSEFHERSQQNPENVPTGGSLAVKNLASTRSHFGRREWVGRTRRASPDYEAAGGVRRALNKSSELPRPILPLIPT
jgi:hypothetical protein